MQVMFLTKRGATHSVAHNWSFTSVYEAYSGNSLIIGFTLKPYACDISRFYINELTSTIRPSTIRSVYFNMYSSTEFNNDFYFDVDISNEL